MLSSVCRGFIHNLSISTNYCESIAYGFMNHDKVKWINNHFSLQCVPVWLQKPKGMFTRSCESHPSHISDLSISQEPSFFSLHFFCKPEKNTFIYLYAQVDFLQGTLIILNTVFKEIVWAHSQDLYTNVLERAKIFHS